MRTHRGAKPAPFSYSPPISAPQQKAGPWSSWLWIAGIVAISIPLLIAVPPLGLLAAVVLGVLAYRGVRKATPSGSKTILVWSAGLVGMGVVVYGALAVLHSG